MKSHTLFLDGKVIASAWLGLTGAVDDVPHDADGTPAAEAPEETPTPAEKELRAERMWTGLARRHGFEASSERLRQKYFAAVARLANGEAGDTVDDLCEIAPLLHGERRPTVPLMAGGGGETSVFEDPAILRKFFPRAAAILSNGYHQ